MTTSDIISTILSIIALLFAVPAFILSVRQLFKKLEFYPNTAKRLSVKKHIDGTFYCAEPMSLTNNYGKNIYIKKITIVTDKKEQDITYTFYIEQRKFGNVQIDVGDTITENFYFSFYRLKKKLTFKIYTNRGIFKRKLSYQLTE